MEVVWQKERVQVGVKIKFTVTVTNKLKNLAEPSAMSSMEEVHFWPSCAQSSSDITAWRTGMKLALSSSVTAQNGRFYTPLPALATSQPPQPSLGLVGLLCLLNISAQSS